MDQVRKLQEKEFSVAASVIAHAFFRDPLSVLAFPDDEQRRHKLPQHFEMLIRYADQYGAVFGIGEPLSGCAIWLTPGNTDITVDRMAKTGLDRAPDLLGHEEMARFDAVFETLERCHTEAMGEDHWYLQVIGTAPEAQGKGLGAKLIRHVLSLADEAGHPCYLETVARANIPFYERLGFRRIHHSIEPSAGLPVWAFRRDRYHV